MRAAWLVLMVAVPAVSAWPKSSLGASAVFTCRVTPTRPDLGFDLRFHADYTVTVPIRALADAGGRLLAAMRVTPIADGESPSYLMQGFTLPDFPPDAKGEGVLAGGFDLGPGRYRVDWTIRDGQERGCTAHWELEAKSGRRQRALPLTLKPHAVAERAELPLDKTTLKPIQARRLHIKVLLNLSPVYSNESILNPADTRVLFSILRGITDQPEVGAFDLLAFNVREQKIVYRQDNLVRLDSSALGRAVRASKAGTIDYRLLRDPRNEQKFVAQLLTNELCISEPSPDVIVIVGPKVNLDKGVPVKLLRAAGLPSCPIYYLNYAPNPGEAWTDTIGSALKAYRSTMVYNLMFPGDLAAAIKDLLAKTRQEAAWSGSERSIEYPPELP